MTILGEAALVIGVVFAINLLPAFGPPTWAVLVFFSFHVGLSTALLVACGALAAASGRFLLAAGSARYRSRLSTRSQANLARSRALLAGNPRRSLAALGLFALSPVPSGQLFVAAGLMELPVARLTAAFFAGRLVSYSIYLTVAGLVEESAGDVVGRALSSPVGIAVQLLFLGALVALVRLDWSRLLSRRGRPDPSASSGTA